MIEEEIPTINNSIEIKFNFAPLEIYILKDDINLFTKLCSF